MKNRKKILLALFLTGLVFFSILAISGCHRENNSNLPHATLLEISAPPDKTKYQLNEPLDLNGCIVTLRFDDDSYKDFHLPHSNFAVYGFNSQTLGKKTITVSYGSLSNIFDIYIVEEHETKYPVSMRIISPPDVSNYTLGSVLNLNGGTIEVTYDDESTQNFNLPHKIFIISGFDSVTTGTKIVTIKLGSLFVEFPVVVSVGRSVTNLAFMSHPTTVNYILGDALNLSGAVVRIEYSDETFDEIPLPDNRFTVSGFDSDVVGEKTVILSLNNFSDTFTVSVQNSPALKFLQDFYKEYSYLDYSSNLVFTHKEFAAARDALANLNSLSAYLLNLLDGGIKEAAVRAGFWACYTGYYDALDTLSPYLTEKGFNTKDTDVINSLIPTLDTVCLISDSLLNAFNNYASVTLYDDVSISSLLNGKQEKLAEDKENIFLPALMAAKTYLLLLPLPKNVTSGAALSPFAAAIEEAYVLLNEVLGRGTFTAQLNTEFNTLYLPTITYFIPEYLEIFYTYYFYINDRDATNTLCSYNMPEIIRDIATAIDKAVYAQNMMAFGKSGVKETDSSEFLIYYRKAMRLINTLTQEGSVYKMQIYTKYILDIPTENGVFKDNTSFTLSDCFKILTASSMLYRYSYGYIMGEYNGDAVFEEFLDDYLSIAEKYLTNNNYSYGYSEFNLDVTRIYGKFLNLDVYRQINFYYILDIGYSNSKNFLYSDNIFNNILLDYYYNSLANSSQRSMYAYIRRAEEACIYLVLNSLNSDYFNDIMASFTAYYNGMSDQNKQGVANFLNAPYISYKNRYENFLKGIDSLYRFNSLVYNTMAAGMNNDYAYSAVYFNELTANYHKIAADEQIYQLFTSINFSGYSALGTNMPLSSWYTFVQDFYNFLLEEFFGAEINDPVFASFLSLALDVIRQNGNCSKGTFNAMMTEFVSITPYQQSLFFDFAYSKFCIVVENHCKQYLSAAEMLLVRRILSAVSQSYAWRFVPGIASYLEHTHYFIDEMYSFLDYYSELVDKNHVGSFPAFEEHFNVLYNFYLSEFNSLLIIPPPDAEPLLDGVMSEVLNYTEKAATAKYNMEVFRLDGTYYCDGTPFMVYYNLLRDAVLSISTAGDIETFATYIYDGKTLDKWYQTLTESFLGYSYLMAEFAGDEVFNSFYSVYLDAAGRYLADELYRAGNAGFDSDIPMLYNAFRDISADRKIHLFKILDIYYRLSDTYKTEQAGPLCMGGNLFYDMIWEYYCQSLTENSERLVFYQILYAEEIYAWYAFSPEYTQLFLSAAKTARTMYNTLTFDNKKNFDLHAGNIYTYYIGEYDRIDNLIKTPSAYTNSIFMLLNEAYTEYIKMVNNFEARKAASNYDTCIFVLFYMRLQNEINDMLNGNDYNKRILYYNFNFSGYLLADLFYELTYADYGYLWFLNLIKSGGLSEFYADYIQAMYNYYFDSTFKAGNEAFDNTFLNLWNSFYAMSNVQRLFFYMSTNATYTGTGFWEKDIMFNIMAREYFINQCFTSAQMVTVYSFFAAAESAAAFALNIITFDTFVEFMDRLILSYNNLDASDQADTLIKPYFNVLIEIYNSVLGITL